MTRSPSRKTRRALKISRPAKAARKAVKTPRPRMPAAPRPAKSAPAEDRAAAEANIARLTRQLATARRRIAELKARADTDFLLDIPNRRGFERNLRRALAYVRRYGTSAALIVLDVDALKPINDDYGHAAGDDLLRHVVRILSSNIRESDTLARLGGDEFAILLWNLSFDEARAKAAALEDKVSATPCEYRGQRLPVAISVGVSSLEADDEPGTVLGRADQEMYVRKQLRRTHRKARIKR